VLTAAERLKSYPKGRCLVLAPTKPLVLQHYQSLQALLNLDKDEFEVLTGDMRPEARASLSQRILFLTPQVLENDLIAGRISLEDVVLMVVDEAHRAVGNYSYVFIAQEYMKQGRKPLLLGLTASPGSAREKIEEVKRNLAVQFIETRTDRSPDVKPYVKTISVEWIGVNLSPPFQQIKHNLDAFLKERLRSIRAAGFLAGVEPRDLSFKNFSKAMGEMRVEIARHIRPPPELQRVLRDLISIRKVSHALELLETQGLGTLRGYFNRLEVQARRSGAASSAKQLLLDGNIQAAINLTAIYDGKGVEHPKLGKLVEAVEKHLKEDARRIIVFTNYRETSRCLTERLNRIPAVRAVRLVGQMNRPSDEGLSQKEQASILSKFREGHYNVLVATQVAEEGIDISTSDAVLFYDNVPSAIRFIQRRGRTGRQSPGKVTILIAKGTRDEAYYWIARRKEKSMMALVRSLQSSAAIRRGENQQNLERFAAAEKTPANGEGASKISIQVDSREGRSAVVKELLRLGVEVKLSSLAVGDYVVTDDVGVERKTVADFSASIIDKRLFAQAREIASAYAKPFLLLEGESLYTVGGVSAQAVRGAVLSVILDFKIPVLWTRNAAETALILYALARREQMERGGHITLRAEKKPLSLKEQQEYVVAGLPNVESTLARRMLEAFESVENIFSATEEDLRNVKGIGKGIAAKIRRVITERYSVKRDEDGEKS